MSENYASANRHWLCFLCKSIPVSSKQDHVV